MVCYAHWADAADFGSASTPMLYHMTGGTITDGVVNTFFGHTVVGTLAVIVHGMLPDMTFKVSGTSEPTFYSARLAQTAFHELGHASMYRQAGAGWWLDVVSAELFHQYGQPGYTNWGKVQVAEAWSEFIGTNYALRRYPNGQKFSAMLGLVRFDRALEEEDWFAENTGWIPCGAFHDLIDVNNTFIDENTWDKIGGSNIKQMYDVFGSSINNMCRFRDQFIIKYPAYNSTLVRNMFNHYNLSCE